MRIKLILLINVLLLSACGGGRPENYVYTKDGKTPDDVTVDMIDCGFPGGWGVDPNMDTNTRFSLNLCMYKKGYIYDGDSDNLCEQLKGIEKYDNLPVCQGRPVIP
ncbi:MAG: hypothetical protein ACWIPH_08895 [Ostreibacterium sp.]